MIAGGPAWLVQHVGAPVAALHALWPDDNPARRQARVGDVVGERAIVLGSNQPDSDVDASLAAAGPYAVVRRRSGGGAVVVGPAAQVWVDVWVPRPDPLWDDDVLRAGHFVGRAWVQALRSFGVADAELHTGRLSPDAWGRRLCFAAVGPGEVLVGGRKVVGVSQRRTRHGALFQSVAPVHADPGLWARPVGAPGVDGPPPAPPADRAVGLDELVAGMDRPGRDGAVAEAVVAALG